MRYRITLLISVICVTFYFSCSKPNTDPSSRSAWVLSKIGDKEFLYSNDILPSAITNESGSDTQYLSYDSQKRLISLKRSYNVIGIDHKSIILLFYQGDQLTRIISKVDVASYDPVYSDPAYETANDLTNTVEYDSLVYQNSHLIAKYHFAKASIGDSFELKHFEKIYYQTTNQDLMSEVESYSYNYLQNNWYKCDSLEFITFDLSHTNPVYNTIKEIGYLSDYVSIFTIPVDNSLSARVEQYACLNQYVLTSMKVTWLGLYPRYDLFTFTNSFSTYGLTRAEVPGHIAGKIKSYAYKQIEY